jgi:hypothetical protein
MPFPKPLDVDWNEVRKALCEEGCSYSDVQKRFGVGRGTVAYHAAKDGWNVSQHRKAQALAKGCMNGKPLRAPSGHLLLARGVKAVIQQFASCEITCKQSFAVALQKASRGLAFMPDSWIIANARDVKCLVEAASLLFGWNDAKRAKNGSRSDWSKAELMRLTPDQLEKLAAVEIDANPLPSLD